MGCGASEKYKADAIDPAESPKTPEDKKEVPNKESKAKDSATAKKPDEDNATEKDKHAMAERVIEQTDFPVLPVPDFPLKFVDVLEKHVAEDSKAEMTDSSGSSRDSSKDSISQNICVVLRHGDRMDCEWDSKWAQSAACKQWPADPPLSPKGIESSKIVGERLRHEIQTNDLQGIVVVSSPYLRCVQTAVEICRSFETSSMRIDNQIGEIWNPNVVGEQASVRPCRTAIKLAKSQGVQIARHPLGSWPSWPEDKREAEIRYAQRFLQYMDLSQRKGFLFILVTHSEGVSAMLRTLPQYKGCRVQGVEYCGAFIARCISHVKSCSGISEDWHVQTQGVHVKARRNSGTPKSFEISRRNSTPKASEIARRNSNASIASTCSTTSTESAKSAHLSQSTFHFYPKGKPVDIIMEAASNGSWPPSPQNALHGEDFFDSSDGCQQDAPNSPSSPVTLAGSVKIPQWNDVTASNVKKASRCSSCPAVIESHWGKRKEAESMGVCKKSGSDDSSSLKRLRWLQAGSDTKKLSTGCPNTSARQVSLSPMVSNISRTPSNVSLDSLAPSSPDRSCDVVPRLQQVSPSSKLLQRRLAYTFTKALEQSTFRGLPVSICISDPSLDDCPILVVSEGFEALTGYKNQEVVGRNCRFLNVGCEMDPETRLKVQTAANGGPSCTVVVQNRRKNGDLFMNLLHLTVMHVSGKQYIVGVQADVTDMDLFPCDSVIASELEAFVNNLHACHLVQWAQQELVNFLK